VVVPKGCQTRGTMIAISERRAPSQPRTDSVSGRRRRRGISVSEAIIRCQRRGDAAKCASLVMQSDELVLVADSESASAALAMKF